MIGENLARIRRHIAEAALRSGRDPSAVTLLAVSKRIDLDRIREAREHGQKIFGENFVQEAREKIGQLDGETTWHFIGHLQSNKARTAVALFDMIETVDRLKIARALNRFAAESGKIQDILVQVNIGREKQKSGVDPERSGEFLGQLACMKNLRLRGLMAMPPFTADPEEARPYFRALKELSDRFREKKYFADNDRVIVSMGMSNDYTVAIEEGATLVRVGTALFGSRN